MVVWLIFGFLLGVGATLLWQNPDVKLAWYDWVMIVFAVAFYVLAVANFNGSMAELEPRAAYFLLVSFGLPGVILTAIVGLRAWRNRGVSGSPSVTSESAA